LITLHVTGSSDGLHAGTTARNLPKSSANHPCCVCRGPNYKSGVSINRDNPRMDGKGLNMICRECWDKNPDQFHRLCLINWRCLCKMKKAWPGFLTDECSGLRQRPMAGDADLDKPDTRSEFVDFLIRKSMRLAVSLTAQIYDLTLDDRFTVFKLTDHWVDEWFNEEESRDYVQAMDCDEMISALVMEFVDQVLPRLEKHFICRQKHCSMLCRRTDWVHNSPMQQYRCPACGEEYQPGRVSPDLWRTNKVCVIDDELNMQLEWAMLKAGGMADPPRNHVMIVPVRWPDTAHEVNIDSIKAIFLEIDFELMSLPRKNRLGFVLANVTLAGPPKVFQQQNFFQHTRDDIDYQNERQAPGNSAWQYDHIEKFGYQGIKLGPEHEPDKPMELYDFVRTCGVAMWLTQKAANASRCA
jgi:hypothetical protein